MGIISDVWVHVLTFSAHRVNVAVLFCFQRWFFFLKLVYWARTKQPKEPKWIWHYIRRIWVVRACAHLLLVTVLCNQETVICLSLKHIHTAWESNTLPFSIIFFTLYVTSSCKSLIIRKTEQLTHTHTHTQPVFLALASGPWQIGASVQWAVGLHFIALSSLQSSFSDQKT